MSKPAILIAEDEGALVTLLRALTPQGGESAEMNRVLA